MVTLNFSHTASANRVSQNQRSILWRRPHREAGARRIAFSESLGSFELRVTDFELALADASPDDFVYLDPPYHRIGGYSDFNRYTSGKFKEIDHLRLRNVCVDLDRRGIRWLQSNSSTEYIREIYRDFRVSEITNRREINLNSKSRDIEELVIKNF